MRCAAVLLENCDTNQAGAALCHSRLDFHVRTCARQYKFLLIFCFILLFAQTYSQVSKTHHHIPLKLKSKF